MKVINHKKLEILKNQFGEKIVELRKERKITQEDLAFLCNTSVSTVIRAEKGKIDPKASSILILANVLNMSSNTLWNYCFPFEEMFFDEI